YYTERALLFVATFVHDLTLDGTVFGLTVGFVRLDLFGCALGARGIGVHGSTDFLHFLGELTGSRLKLILGVAIDLLLGLLDSLLEGFLVVLRSLVAGVLEGLLGRVDSAVEEVLGLYHILARLVLGSVLLSLL